MCLYFRMFISQWNHFRLELQEQVENVNLIMMLWVWIIKSAARKLFSLFVSSYFFSFFFSFLVFFPLSLFLLLKFIPFYFFSAQFELFYPNFICFQLFLNIFSFFTKESVSHLHQRVLGCQVSKSTEPSFTYLTLFAMRFCSHIYIDIFLLILIIDLVKWLT